MSAISAERVSLTFSQDCLKSRFDVSNFGAKPSPLNDCVFKTITLKIPESYLESDQNAKIQAILLAIATYHLALQSHDFEEKAFKIAIWDASKGNCNLTHPELFHRYAEHISQLNEALQLMQSVVVANGITYSCTY